jgi:peptidoglycan/LPS O-acetylase OafA/YrhL
MKPWTPLLLAQNLVLFPGVYARPPLIIVTWTLSYEFLWYVTVPLLVQASGLPGWRRAHRMLFFATLAVLYIVVCLLHPWLEIRAVHYVAGVLLYEALHCSSMRRWLTAAGEGAALLTFLSTVPLTYLVQTHGWDIIPGLGARRESELGRTLLVAVGLFGLIGVSFGRDGGSALQGQAVRQIQRFAARPTPAQAVPGGRFSCRLRTRAPPA